MSKALVHAIDELLAFLEERRNASAKAYHAVGLTKADMTRFDELDAAVYRLATKAELDRCLPQSPELDQSLNFPGLPRPVRLEGLTNLPGDWLEVGNPPKWLFMNSIYRDRWLLKMTALRGLAESICSEQPATAEASDESSKGKGGRPPRGKPSVNSQMLDLITTKPECKGWTARQFATALSCAESSVKDSAAWKRLAPLRLQTKAERNLDKAKRRR